MTAEHRATYCKANTDCSLEAYLRYLLGTNGKSDFFIGIILVKILGRRNHMSATGTQWPHKKGQRLSEVGQRSNLDRKKDQDLHHQDSVQMSSLGEKLGNFLRSCRINLALGRTPFSSVAGRANGLSRLRCRRLFGRR